MRIIKRDDTRIPIISFFFLKKISRTQFTYIVFNLFRVFRWRGHLHERPEAVSLLIRKDFFRVFERIFIPGWANNINIYFFDIYARSVWLKEA